MPHTSKPVDADWHLGQARSLAASGQDEAARQAYVEVLTRDPANFAALIELGALALSGGYRSAAYSAYSQAVRFYPQNPICRVNLGHLKYKDGNFEAAAQDYRAALATDPNFAPAHQGLARVLSQQGDEVGAAFHRRVGFSGRGALISKPFRGEGKSLSLLLLVSIGTGNIPTQHWIDDRSFTIHGLYVDFFDPSQPLPAHDLVMNAIGDADLCQAALMRADKILSQTTAPIINAPANVKQTGRADNARRISGIPNVLAPTITQLSSKALSAGNFQKPFPYLLRALGFHTGEHFYFIDSASALDQALQALPDGDVLAIDYIDARGADGMARKYRVLFIDGALYPVHMAVSRDWKVHYFSADMAENASFREEEQRFLTDMPSVLGAQAMVALEKISILLGLDYAGIDFGLTQDGRLIFFEANATMVVTPPDANPMWDYRRPAIEEVLEAAKAMALQRAASHRLK